MNRSSGSAITRSRTRVAVIGAGMGGLSAALELLARGAEVTIFERSDQVGGKMRREQVGSVSVDAGPTVLTMLHVFEELFARLGLDLHEHVTIRSLDRLARHAWTDGTRFDLYRDEEQTAQEIESVFGSDEADNYRRFSAHCRALLGRVKAPFMEAERPGLGAALKAQGLSSVVDMMRVDWHRSMHRAISSMLKTPHLQQLFARYATYYGSSPYSAPATLNLIAEVEREGVWVVEGGMHELALAMAKVFETLGGRLELGAPVDAMRRVGGNWELSSMGASGRYDAVVFNGNPDALGRGLLGEEVKPAVKTSKRPRSASAVTWCIEGRLEGDFDADFHNVFFSDDYKAEFDALFGREASIPERPSVYLCAQSRAPGRLRSAGDAESLFILINAPAKEPAEKLTRGDIDRCEAQVHKLLRQCGLQLQTLESRVTTPLDFARRFPSSGGALYGEATHSPFTPFFRLTARSKLPGLYLAGGSTHPGAGVPMACTSGRFAAQAIAKDLDLTLQSPPVATSGGTSTSLPTMAAQR